MPPKRKNLIDVCEKLKNVKGKDEYDAQKGAKLKFFTYQYLYISELLGLGLGRKLYLPPLD